MPAAPSHFCTIIHWTQAAEAEVLGQLGNWHHRTCVKIHATRGCSDKFAGSGWSDVARLIPESGGSGGGGRRSRGRRRLQQMQQRLGRLIELFCVIRQRHAPRCHGSKHTMHVQKRGRLSGLSARWYTNSSGRRPVCHVGPSHSSLLPSSRFCLVLSLSNSRSYSRSASATAANNSGPKAPPVAVRSLSASLLALQCAPS